MKSHGFSTRDRWFVGLVPTLVIFGAACAHTPDVAPEEKVFRSASWSELQLVHRHVSGRLDGVVAGAFTEKVAELFARRWDLLDEFAQLTVRHRGFEADVFAALNEAVTQTRASEIRANARTRCPAAHSDLCARLLVALAP